MASWHRYPALCWPGSLSTSSHLRASHQRLGPLHSLSVALQVGGYWISLRDIAGHMLITFLLKVVPDTAKAEGVSKALSRGVELMRKRRDGLLGWHAHPHALTRYSLWTHGV